jgi:hypothetical protein
MLGRRLPEKLVIFSATLHGYKDCKGSLGQLPRHRFG